MKKIAKTLVYDNMNNVLGINTDGIRFHAVHRVGQIAEGKCRPIIARFVSREDRDEVGRNRTKIKNSNNYKDAYINEDFAKAIQEERKILIKAIMKARREHGIHDAKVTGRFLLINNERYDHQTIPDFLN